MLVSGQFEMARLSVFNSTWSDIYDFTQVEHEKNFSLISEEKNLLDFVPLPSSVTSGVDFDITSSIETSVVPLTHGFRRKPSNETCFVALFGASDLEDRAWRLLRELQLQVRPRYHDNGVFIHSHCAFLSLSL